LGASARRFVDFLAEAGVRWWQILPLGPTDPSRGHSPYSALSAFALDPRFIDGDDLREQGLITSAEPTIEAAARTLVRDDPQTIDRFADEHAWVRDWARFVVIGRGQAGRWQTWPTPLRDRDLGALERIDGAATREAIAVQWIAHQQWARLREHARARGVRLFGDLPMYVVAESADVWAEREGFCLDHDGEPHFESGVPPDDFSASGQRWESPVYDWATMRASEFRWWRERLACEAARLDMLRLDHFRGFAAYWQIPRGESAIAGEWITGPGFDLFDRVFEQIDPAFFVAEDLGIIDAPVRELLDRTGLPGMRVLQFGFGGGVEHLPEQHPRACVAYTGTHDNDTLVGWWTGLEPAMRERVGAWLGPCADPVATLIERLLASEAALAIVPLQDLLGLGSEARMNTPGQAEGNWIWRAREADFDDALVDRTRTWLDQAGRRASLTA
jgi:4-alpha-glucanotransferase